MNSGGKVNDGVFLTIIHVKKATADEDSTVTHYCPPSGALTVITRITTWQRTHTSRFAHYIDERTSLVTHANNLGK